MISFDYRVYLLRFVFVPFVALLAGGAILGIAVFRFFKCVKRKHTAPRSILCLIFTLAVFAAISVFSANRLLNGGLSLLVETQAHEDITIGVIEDITMPSKRFPFLREAGQRGADIQIDGAAYFALTAKGFQEGDIVSIWYHPGSGFILHMEYAQIHGEYIGDG